MKFINSTVVNCRLRDFGDTSKVNPPRETAAAFQAPGLGKTGVGVGAGVSVGAGVEVGAEVDVAAGVNVTAAAGVAEGPQPVRQNERRMTNSTQNNCLLECWGIMNTSILPAEGDLNNMNIDHP